MTFLQQCQNFAKFYKKWQNPCHAYFLRLLCGCSIIHKHTLCVTTEPFLNQDGGYMNRKSGAALVFHVHERTYVLTRHIFAKK